MHIGRVGSVLATLSVVVERFIAIKYPLKTIRRSRFLIIISLVSSIIYNIPRFFEFETVYPSNSNESIIGTSDATEFNNSTSDAEGKVYDK